MTVRYFEDVFTGGPSTVALARRWVRRTLSAAEVCDGTIDDVLVCVSELATNAVLHTRSGDEGGMYQVILAVHPGRVHAEVVDQGSEQAPDLCKGCGETGRGLMICAGLGTLQHETTGDGRRRVWVEVDQPRADAPPTPAPWNPAADESGR
jgi:anti-sigma regulatory factor (Ser/Thr protein kinase)